MSETIPEATYDYDGTLMDLSEITAIQSYKLAVSNKGEIEGRFNFTLKNITSSATMYETICDREVKETVKSLKPFWERVVTSGSIYNTITHYYDNYDDWEEHYEAKDEYKEIYKNYKKFVQAWRDWKQYEKTNQQ